MKSVNNILVIGASSLIARQLIDQHLAGDESLKIIAVSRSKPVNSVNSDTMDSDRLRWLQCDYAESSIAAITQQLQVEKAKFVRVYVCNGVLHDKSIAPEKRLENLQIASFEQVMHTNAIIPLLWLKHLKPILKGSDRCLITVFSARVGSIRDNGLGGWYAYRASKAALNMMIKNASIEFGRIAKQTRFLIFHPGTTDTPLSRPFQKSVPRDKLLTPAFVATQLLRVSGDLPLEAGVDYLDWRGKVIPW